MFTLFRWLVRIFSAILALSVGTAIVVYYFADRSLPDYNATYRIEGLTGPVEIVRDTADVPHVFAKSDEDVYFGLGFAEAQDRLWQMTLLRRTAQGRLSEVFGPATVKSDELMRRLDLYALATRSVAAQDAPARAALDAYARGINAWIKIVNEGALGRGAPEFFFVKNEIAFWQPADSIAILKLLAIQSSAQMHDEVLRARVSLLSKDWVRDILPDVPGPGVAALPPYASLVPGTKASYAALTETPLPFLDIPEHSFAGASNAWAAAPERAAAAGSLLANDPHHDFSAPSLWYLARIELASGGVIGATVPGVPAILAGRNADFGWGITAAWLDDQDIFLEELDPSDPDRYRTADGWKPFEERRVIVSVKDAQPLTLTLRWSDNGPVIPGDYFDLKSVTPRGHVATLAATALADDDRSMSAAIRLMSARSTAEGIAAGEDYIAPAQMVTMADHEGIAMALFGAAPARDPLMLGQGRVPALGWMATNRWQGRRPYATNPRFVHPEGGIVGNTNNKIVDRPFPDHISFDWGDTQRVQRWTRLMQEREVHSRESFIAAQLDTISPAARTLLPLVGKDLWFTGEAAPAGTPERLRQRALELLAEWDGDMNEHLPEPLIYAAWIRALQTRLIRDELGPLADAFTHIEPLFIERVYRDIDGASRWCDIMQSAPTETCSDIARMSLDDALLQLSERYGPNPESWRWGDAHQAAQDHALLGKTPLLKWIVNIRQSTSGGDYTLARGLTAGTGPDPYLNVNGAGYRGVYDFADPDSSVFIISTGQSGHPLSRHYDDMSELWRRGEYVPMSLDPDLARAAATGITELEPAGAP
ncbi:MAG: penicillin acylase family protein [Defluviimonas sp.]|uniref:penicillin acylase family protein n=1 Tax=Albidovulum sp. TaxID=1872424 RepID=UPI001D684C21|nr:penicillin acylase family protein [Paracoccaceae bacterium]MCC0063949.1 penicillin acylase family protein [Defluviimonas sp.]